MTRKELLIIKVKEGLGDIQEYSEYNQFLCDTIVVLINHLDLRGLELLIKDIEGIRDSMKR